VVDLPAPLGPRNPSTSPLPTEKEILSTAVNGPNLLVNPSMEIMLDTVLMPLSLFNPVTTSRPGKIVIETDPCGQFFVIRLDG
jgi:hypothetical protein